MGWGGQENLGVAQQSSFGGVSFWEEGSKTVLWGGVATCFGGGMAKYFGMGGKKDLGWHGKIL